MFKEELQNLYENRNEFNSEIFINDIVELHNNELNNLAKMVNQIRETTLDILETKSSFNDVSVQHLTIMAATLAEIVDEINSKIDG